ncbi:MAG: zinc-binding dehydrogenase [Alphaproteobacteria bacterium]|nr:zinc-binding dehydrogenase [Alphaproteobacteria bacterium]
MKAMVLTGPGKPFELQNVPDPVPQAGEAVARVLACGSGLTIQHIRAGRVTVDYPRIIGHEITAEIVETGAGVTAVKVGDPVTAYFYLTCGTCQWCLKDRETLCDNYAGNVGREIDGGYAEFIKLPSSAFIKLPEGLDYQSHPAEVGVITDAVATPLKLIKKARIEPGETVAVIGAGGGLGLHMVMMAHWRQTNVIAVDIQADKLEACRAAGAADVLDVSETDLADGILQLTAGRGADVVIDFVGNPQTLEAACRSLGKGGRLAILGGGGSSKPFQASGNLIKSGELEVLGSMYATKSEVREALEIAARGEVWPIVSEIRRLEEAEALHQRIEDGSITGRAALRIM